MNKFDTYDELAACMVFPDAPFDDPEEIYERMKPQIEERLGRSVNIREIKEEFKKWVEGGANLFDMGGNLVKGLRTK